MNYELIGSDFDETLVLDNEAISPENIASIQKYLKLGGKFVIATGREYIAVEPRLAELPFLKDAPLITNQGALVIIPSTQEVLFKQVININLVKRIVTYILENTFIEVALFTFENIHTFTGRQKYSKFYTDTLNVAHRKKDFSSVEDLMEKFPNLEVLKICVFEDPALLQDAINKLNVAFEGEIKFIGVSEWLGECVSLKCNKGIALEFVANYYKIPFTKTIAVGDSLNDLSMIKVSGLGIGVNNLNLNLLFYCKYIVPVGGNSQISYVIEKAINDEPFQNTFTEKMDILKTVFLKNQYNPKKIMMFTRHLERVNTEHDNLSLKQYSFIRKNIIKDVGLPRFKEIQKIEKKLEDYTKINLNKYERIYVIAHLANIAVQ